MKLNRAREPKFTLPDANPPLSQNAVSPQYDALGHPGHVCGNQTGHGPDQHVGEHYSEHGEPIWGAGPTFGPTQVGSTVHPLSLSQILVSDRYRLF